MLSERARSVLHAVIREYIATGGPVGRLIPKPRKSASIPSAASTPKPMPTAEETSPTMAASPSTERKT